MKRRICLLTLMLALLALSFPLVTLAEIENVAKTEMQAAVAEAISMLSEEREPGTILVSMKDDATLEDAQKLFSALGILSDLEDRSVCRYRSYDDGYTDLLWFTLMVPEEQIQDLLVLLNLDEKVLGAYPNYLLSNDEWEELVIDIDANTSSSDNYDPDTTAWAMDQINYSGSFENKPSTKLLVGVLDSGYNKHKDMDCVDMSRARNFYEIPESTDVHDNSGHGTFIVGEIGASLNGTGVNGVCKNVTIVPIKIAEYDPTDGIAYTSSERVARGVNYAEAEQIKVLNLSYTFSAAIKNALMNTSNYTDVLVCSAGNKALDIADSPSIGAINDVSNWIYVGASNSAGTKCSFSNYSKQYVDLFAPGDAIKGIDKDGVSYVKMSGTSMAAPFVTAAAAILLENNPFLSSDDVCAKLIGTVTKTSALTNYCVSGGILNLASATNSLYSDYRGAYSLGDLNGDGIVNGDDSILIERYIRGTLSLSAKALKAADVDGDGEVDSTDYLLIKRFVLMTYYFPPALVR